MDISCVFVKLISFVGKEFVLCICRICKSFDPESEMIGVDMVLVINLILEEGVHMLMKDLMLRRGIKTVSGSRKTW